MLDATTTRGDDRERDRVRVLRVLARGHRAARGRVRPTISGYLLEDMCDGVDLEEGDPHEGVE